MELFSAITDAIQQAQDEYPRDRVAALRVVQATLSDPAMDLGAYLSTAESKVPAEFHALQRAIERTRRASSSQEVDERVASQLLSNLIFDAARATIAAAPPY
jgi:hypothetical protein